MEVVGVVANFIAIAQALETGAKVVNLLREIPGISGEMMALNNEIESLRITVETARAQVAAALEDEPEPPDLRAARLCIEQMARDMQAIVTGCTSAKGKDGKIKPKYLKWLWLQKELKACHDKTRDAKSSLGLALLTLNLKQTTYNNQLVLRLESYVVRQTTLEFPSSVRQRLLPAPREVEQSQQLQTEHSIEELTLGMEQVMVADRRQKTGKATGQGDNSDMIAFKAKLSMRGRCKSPCPCHCHGVPTSTFTTARWARNLVGSLFVSYDRLPLFGSSVACTEADCKGNTQTSTNFTYQFPTWLCSRYISLQAAFNSSVGFSLRPVRMLANDDVIWHTTINERAVLREFIKNKSLIFPDDCASDGLTLLEWAIRNAPGEVLAFLVQVWSDELGKDNYNPTWLYQARRHLDWWPNIPADAAEALRAIAFRGEEIVDTAETPLHEAVRLDKNDNDDEVSGRVREAAAQYPWAISQWDDRGQTPLHTAAMKGNLAAVKELVRLGGDFDHRNFEGHTVLMEAIKHGHTTVVRYLLDAGCSVNAAAPNGFTALQLAATWQKELEGGPAEILRILLAAGVAVNARDGQEKTALHHLVSSRSTKNTIKVRAQVLLRAGADINARDCQGNTPLMFSVMYNSLPSLQELTEAGASTNDSNWLGRNLLHLAAEYAGIGILEHLTTVDPLVVDHEQLDIDGNSPWDSFVWTLHTPQWKLGDHRKPDPDVQQAFAALYQRIRDRNLQFDIDALQGVRQYLTEKDGRGAAAALAPLTKRKKEWKHEAESDTYDAVALQIRQGMWEAALESVDENVELLLEKMDQSPWDQESCCDWLKGYYATESDEEEDEDDCVTIDDEESASNGHVDSNEEDGGSYEGDATV